MSSVLEKLRELERENEELKRENDELKEKVKELFTGIVMNKKGKIVHTLFDMECDILNAIDEVIK